MNDSTTFESILDTKAEDVERPKPLPAGTYEAIIRGMYETGQSSKKKTPFVRFTYALTAAGDDVDTEDLTECLTNKKGEVTPLTERSIKDTYYTTPDALFMLTEMLERIGIKQEGTIRAMLNETPNTSILVEIHHEASEDGASIFPRVKRVLGAA